MIPPSLASVEEVITEIQSAGIQLHYEHVLCEPLRGPSSNRKYAVWALMFIDNYFFLPSAPEWPVIRQL